LKSGLPFLLFSVLVVSAALAQTQAKIFSNIDDTSSGWGSCSQCAGGLNDADVYWTARFQTSPSRDGNSTQLYISASKPFANALYWKKLGAQDSATHFTWDFWVYLDKASLGAEALEYDLFQYANGTEYMFGSECVYSTGYWNIWSQAKGKWIATSLACKRFSPNTWHHIVWQFHRTPDAKMHYDWLALDGVQHALNITAASGPLPSGWTDNVGVQWQIDTSSAPLTVNEWIDNVKITAY